MTPVLARVRSRTGALVAVVLVHVLLGAVFAFKPASPGAHGASGQRAVIEIISIAHPPPAPATELPAPTAARLAPPPLVVPALTNLSPDAIASVPQAPPAPPDAPEPQTAVAESGVTQRALRDLPSIVRQLGNPDAPRLQLRTDSFSTKLERGIAAAARLTIIRQETIELGDGRIMTKVTTNRGSYCYASRSAGLSGGRDVFQRGVGDARSVECSD